MFTVCCILEILHGRYSLKVPRARAPEDNKNSARIQNTSVSCRHAPKCLCYLRILPPLHQSDSTSRAWIRMEILRDVAVPLVALVVGLVTIKWLFRKDKHRSQAPPGPRRWPILGNIPALAGNHPHISMTKLAVEKKWPIMSLQISKIKMLVVSTPELAKEVLIKSGIAFASRNVNGTNFALKALLEMPPDSGNYRAVAGAPYGHQWRVNRKILTIGLIKMLKYYGDRLLFEEVNMFESYVDKNQGQVLNVRELLWKILANHNLRFLFGKRFSYDDPDLNELVQLNEDVGTCLGKGAVVEMFPILAPFHRKWENLIHYVAKRKTAVLEGFIEHRRKLGKSEEDWYFVDTVLEGERLGEIDHEDTIRILDEVNLAGNETTASTIEWAFAELANRPEIYRKIQDEIDQVLGKGVPIRAQDIEKLPYLRAFVKENFRVHMHLPLGLPHVNQEPAKLGGYDIPKDSVVHINSYAIARNPEIWPEPEKFDPDRFLREDVDVTGQDCRLLPFGGGRRVCAGIPLALPQVHILIARVAQRYQLVIPNGSKTLEMADEFGIGVRKLNPLKLELKRR